MLAFEDTKRRIPSTPWYQMHVFGVRFIFQTDPATTGQIKAVKELNHMIQSIELIVMPQQGYQAH